MMADMPLIPDFLRRSQAPQKRLPRPQPTAPVPVLPSSAVERVVEQRKRREDRKARAAERLEAQARREAQRAERKHAETLVLGALETQRSTRHLEKHLPLGKAATRRALSRLLRAGRIERVRRGRYRVV